MESHNLAVACPDFSANVVREIDAILNRLEELAQTARDEDDFFRQVAQHTLAAISANCVSIWSYGPQNHLHLNLQAGAEKTFLSVEPTYLDSERRRLGNSNDNEVVIVRTAERVEQVVISCQFGENKRGIVACYLDPTIPAAARPGYLEFVQAISEILTEYERIHDRRDHQKRCDDWKRYEKLSLAVHRDWSIQEVAFQLVNEGRGFLGCDRLSVAIRNGKQYRLVAVSGIDLVDRRSELAKSLETLIRRVAQTRETMVFDGRATNIEPQINGPLNEFLDCSAAKSLMIVPLNKSESGSRPFGAVVVEQIQGPKPQNLLAKTTALTEHAVLALGRTYQLRQVPFLQTALVLRPLWVLFQRRYVPRWILATAVLAVLVSLIAFVSVDFRISVRGHLKPVVEKKIFASADGVVREVMVHDGDTVTENQMIIQLESKELNLEKERVSGELATARKRWNAIDAERLANQVTSRSSEQRANQLSADELAIKEHISNLTKQLELILQQKEDLKLHSPIAGKILSWDLQNDLTGRPVQQGQSLMVISKLDGPWVIRFDVPDHRMGPILKSSHENSEPLMVKFKLANEPQKEYLAQVEKIDLATQSRDGQTATVRIEATFDSQAMTQLRPGATVVGKVHCGKRAIGYVWFGEFYEELRRRFF